MKISVREAWARNSAENENCLAGKKCPSCKSGGPFQVLTEIWIEMEDEGYDFPEALDFQTDDCTPCRCVECNYRGEFSKFSVPEKTCNE